MAGSDQVEACCTWAFAMFIIGCCQPHLDAPRPLIYALKCCADKRAVIVELSWAGL